MALALVDPPAGLGRPVAGWRAGGRVELPAGPVVSARDEFGSYVTFSSRGGLRPHPAGGWVGPPPYLRDVSRVRSVGGEA